MEDGKIHCLKEGGVADDGRVIVKRDTATLYLSASCRSTRSGWCRTPLVDIEEDKEELEENEVILE